MDLEKQYLRLKDDYSDYLNEFKRVVDKILKRHEVPVAFGVAGRLKEFDSILEKNSSGRTTIVKSITELNDLVGLRIVLLFPEYKDRVIQLLLNEFKPWEAYVKDDLVVDKFGYSSEHLILGVKDEWVKTPDWENHADKKIEVQIRTLSEHVWSETSHTLFYKKEENIPKAITRDLYRLAAILEVVDEKMQYIKEQVESHFAYIRNCAYDIILTMDLNPETFRRVMIEKSNKVYNLNDKQNKILSSQIEENYNILNAQHLDKIISNKIGSEVRTNDSFIQAVISVLDSYKMEIDEKQKTKEE
nr:hypothetical protein [Allomuricauda sp.]